MNHQETIGKLHHEKGEVIRVKGIMDQEYRRHGEEDHTMWSLDQEKKYMISVIREFKGM